MPVGQGARVLIRGQVSPQPLLLGRASAVGDLAVEGDDVPSPQVVRVVPLAVAGAVGVKRRGCCTEVGVVAGGAGHMIVVVSRRGTGAILVAPPGRPVAVVELVQGTVRVGVVPHGDAGTRDVVEKLRGRLVL